MNISLSDIAKRLNWDGPMEVNTPNARGNTLLRIALTTGGDEKDVSKKSEVIAALLELGANPNQPDPLSWRPLELAIDAGSTDIVRLLVEKGAKPSLCGDLLSSAALRFDQRSHHGSHAVTEPDEVVKMANYLLDIGVKFKGISVGSWEIMKACVDGNIPPDLLKRFKKAGLRVMGVNTSSGRLMLHEAIVQKKASLIETLLEMGEDIHLKDRWGKTALHQFIIHLNLQNFDYQRFQTREEFVDYTSKVLALISKKNPNWNVEDNEGQTPLFNLRTSTSDISPIIKSLFEQGMDINHVDVNGDTPMLAFLKNIWRVNGEFLPPFEKMLVRFLEYGSKVNLQNQQGESALHLVHQPTLIDLLIKAGADPTLKNKVGETPLDIYLKNGKTEAVALLQKKLLQQTLKKVDPHSKSTQPRL